jgi:hypothetical protein
MAARLIKTAVVLVAFAMNIVSRRRSPRNNPPEAIRTFSVLHISEWK